ASAPEPGTRSWVCSVVIPESGMGAGPSSEVVPHAASARAQVRAKKKVAVRKRTRQRYHVRGRCRAGCLGGGCGAAAEGTQHGFWANTKAQRSTEALRWSGSCSARPRSVVIRPKTRAPLARSLHTPARQSLCTLKNQVVRARETARVHKPARGCGCGTAPRRAVRTPKPQCR